VSPENLPASSARPGEQRLKNGRGSDLALDVLKESTRKNGRRTRAPAAGRLRRRPRPVPSPRVRLLSVARSTVGYVSKLVARDARDVPPIRTLVSQYPQYGYRTIRIFLERQGHTLGTDRAFSVSRCSECVRMRPPTAVFAMNIGAPSPTFSNDAAKNGRATASSRRQHHAL
jgi:hypothetical protein